MGKSNLKKEAKKRRKEVEAEAERVGRGALGEPGQAGYEKRQAAHPLRSVFLDYARTKGIDANNKAWWDLFVHGAESGARYVLDQQGQDLSKQILEKLKPS